MKQVIFICLLSVSMCLSDTAAVGNSSVPLEKHDIVANTNKTIPAANVQPQDNVNPAPPNNNNNTNTVPKENKTTISPAKDTIPPAKDTIPPAKDTIPPAKDVTTKSSTENATVPSPPTPKNSSEIPSNHSTPAKTNSTTVPPADHKPSSTVTPKTIVPSPSTPTVQARGFDGASFVGGIILTLGLLAIGFMGFKYYKNQTERNYHTL